MINWNACSVVAGHPPLKNGLPGPFPLSEYIFPRKCVPSFGIPALFIEHGVSIHGSGISKFTDLRVYSLCYSNCLTETDPTELRFRKIHAGIIMNLALSE